MATTSATSENMRLDPDRLISKRVRDLYLEDHKEKQRLKQIRWYIQPAQLELLTIKQRAHAYNDMHLPLLASDSEWKGLLHKLNHLLQNKDLKNFYALPGMMTIIQVQYAPMRALNDANGDIILDKRSIEKELAEYYKKIIIASEDLPSTSDTVMEEKGSQPINIAFSTEDIFKAIKFTNFTKAIGEDEFDGRILEANHEFLERVANEIGASLISQTLPTYFSSGRLVPLSKKAGETAIGTDNIRLIVVRATSLISQKSDTCLDQ